MSYTRRQLTLTHPKPLYPVTGFSGIPHPGKVASGGEDSAFQSAKTSFSVLGVADGVGSWSFEKGIDASQYSRKLMRKSLEFVSQFDTVPPEPQEVILHAWEEINKAKEEIAGSSTACICVVDHLRHTLNVSNLGDSGLVIFRKTQFLSHAGGSDELLYRGFGVAHNSPRQVVSFNCPFQLGQRLKTGETPYHTPDDADSFKLALLPDDVMILSTDGLFDNVELADILAKSVDALLSHQSVSETASLLANTAHQQSLDQSRDSPFAKAAKDNMILWRKGGRPDDITIFVSQFKPERYPSHGVIQLYPIVL